MKAVNSRTGTVHHARDNGFDLVQRCGITSNQHVYLTAVADDVQITCKRCGNADQRAKAKAKVARPPRQTYGKQEWSLTELRELAAGQQIPGRSKMTGDELFAAVHELMPSVD